jgi:hypothetical protein
MDYTMALGYIVKDNFRELIRCRMFLSVIGNLQKAPIQ